MYARQRPVRERPGMVVFSESYSFLAPTLSSPCRERRRARWVLPGCNLSKLHRQNCTRTLTINSRTGQSVESGQSVEKSQRLDFSTQRISKEYPLHLASSDGQRVLRVLRPCVRPRAGVRPRTRVQGVCRHEQDELPRRVGHAPSAEPPQRGRQLHEHWPRAAHRPAVLPAAARTDEVRTPADHQDTHRAACSMCRWGVGTRCC